MSTHQRSLGLESTEAFPPGFHCLPGYLSAEAQKLLLCDVESILEKAPLFEQRMPRTGAPLSVRMSNAGDYGWVTDLEGGYRYQRTHPITGQSWPPIPSRLLQIWTELTEERELPNLCLINFYDQEARLGLHQDKGESELGAPVVSISLGDDATFLLGGLTRKAPVRPIALHSGDVVWFGGPSRLIYHGVKGIQPGTSDLLERSALRKQGRINLTLRRIGPAPTGERTPPS